MTADTEVKELKEKEIVDFDEQEFRQQLDADAFQTELDEAIKEYRLSDVITKLYPFDKQQLEYEIETQGVKYLHRFKNPQDDDEMRKEAMSKIIRRNAGKFQGDDTVEAYNDNSRALKRYYDGLSSEVFGYPMDENDDGERWVPTSTVIIPADQVTEDDRKYYHLGSDENRAVTLLDCIPDADKLKAAALIHGGSCFVIFEKGKRIRSVREKREYIVKQLFGVKRNDDGTLSRPDNVVAYHFREADAPAIGKFDTFAISGRTVLKTKGQPEEHRVINVSTCKELFAAHIKHIQGASIKNEEVKQIEQGDVRLKDIPAACQRDSVFVYFNFLKS